MPLKDLEARIEDQIEHRCAWHERIQLSRELIQMSRTAIDESRALLEETKRQAKIDGALGHRRLAWQRLA